jgi:hypothetical protein
VTSQVDILEVMAGEISRGIRKRVWPGHGFHVYVDLDRAAQRVSEDRAAQKEWQRVVTVGLQALAAKKRAAAQAYFACL